jgi:hypothetical protein
MATSILRRGLVVGRVIRLHCQVCIEPYYSATQVNEVEWSYKDRTSHLQQSSVHHAHMLPNQHPRGNAHLSMKFQLSHEASSHNPAWEHCFLACSGINFATMSTGIPLSSLGLKLKRGGRKRPFGRRVFASRSSSKKG